MYGIIQDTIFEGTLRDRWQALVVFMAMIVLADAEDNVDMTVAALAGRTGLPLGVVAEGVAILEQADEFSRTPGEDGRRIVRLDDHRPWGWHVVNRGKYKTMRRSEDRREYHREYRRKKRAEAKDEHLFTTPFTPVHTCSPQAVGSRQEIEPKDLASGEAEISPISESSLLPRTRNLIERTEPEGFAEWYLSYPRRVKRLTAGRAFGRAVRRDGLAAVVSGTPAWIRIWQESETMTEFIPHPATFLNAAQYLEGPPDGEGQAEIDAEDLKVRMGLACDGNSHHYSPAEWCRLNRLRKSPYQVPEAWKKL